MIIKASHRRAARTLWDCGGRIDDAAEREGLQPTTLRKWLAEPEFRALVAQDALEPILQATSAMLRWAPVAVARLIADLEGDSAAEARQAAREILKLALDTQRELARADERRQEPYDPNAPRPGAYPRDPLERQVAGLTDEALARILAILNGEQETPAG